MSVSGPVHAASPAPRARLLFPESWPSLTLATVVIAIGAFVAYLETFSAPFIFDDLPGIVSNPTIRQLWPIGDVLFPRQASGTGVVGRPIVNLSLAINHALGGLDPWGYHLVNFLVHVAAGVLLFAILRHTLTGKRSDERLRAAAVPIALAGAVLWVVHPIQTESVTCVIQRTESMVGAFYLLTLFAFVRATDSPAHSHRRWAVIAVAACLLGMATKEVMVTAPVVVLLYDRTFVAGSFRAAWQRHGRLHLALFATWLPLLWLVVQGGGRGGTAGFSLGLGVGDYLLTQCRAIVLYLKLALWPDPLVLDYGMPVVRRFGDVWPQAALLGVLALATLIALFRWPVMGFVGAWFFLTLAPSSSVVPLATQTIAEHRMYLPLAASSALLAIGTSAMGGRRGVWGLVGLALAWGALTLRRNADYESALTIWADTIAKVPENARARYNYANALTAAGRSSDAVAQYEQAIAREPRYAAAHYNLGGALLQIGRTDDAIAHYQAALRLEPDAVDTHVNLAAALVRAGRMPEAVAEYEKASRLGLLAAEEQLRFGRALAEVGRLDDALAHLNEAVRLNPKDSATHVVLGMVLSARGQATEALHHLTEAVILNPDDAGARAALGDALIEGNRPAEALTHYEAALRLQPAQAAMLHTSIGNALIRLGRAEDAMRHYEEALRLNPDDAEARKNLTTIRAGLKRRAK